MVSGDKTVGAGTGFLTGKVSFHHWEGILGTATATPWMAFNDTKITKSGLPVSELSKALGTPAPPCCSDSISSIACRRLQAANPTKFLQRCKSEADFSLIQCCNTCGMESAADRYAVLFRHDEQSSNCFDRHGTDFCQRFLKRGDVWGPSQFSCDGQFATLAFRICRKTCNYCRANIYSTNLGRYEPTPCGKPAILMPRA